MSAGHSAAHELQGEARRGRDMEACAGLGGRGGRTGEGNSLVGGCDGLLGVQIATLYVCVCVCVYVCVCMCVCVCESV